jgi:hypothetical protein
MLEQRDRLQHVMKNKRTGTISPTSRQGATTIFLCPDLYSECAEKVRELGLWYSVRTEVTNAMHRIDKKLEPLSARILPASPPPHSSHLGYFCYKDRLNLAQRKALGRRTTLIATGAFQTQWADPEKPPGAGFRAALRSKGWKGRQNRGPQSH